MTTADPISVGSWTAQPDIAVPGTRAGEYIGRHRKAGPRPFTLRRLFYVARHHRR